MPRRAALDVDTDRRRTVRAAVDMASVVGLEGLTIGRLADRLDMSKSSLAGRFRSREQLQLATLELAIEMFVAAVYTPARRQPAGRARLLAICDHWIKFLGQPCFAGGCFLTTASVEFDARDGAVHDAVKRAMDQWLGVLETQAAVAIAAGEISSDADPAEIAFKLNALAMGINCDYQLHGRASTLQLGRRAMASVLESAHQASA
jgi:AcrR family transcriptional regulator